MKTLYERDGYLTGIEILSDEEVERYRAEFDAIEQSVGKRASQVGITNKHKENPVLWKLATHPRILETMREILGEDLLLLGTHFFCKYPDLNESFVSWHQDVTYWGLKPAKAATLWLAIDDADHENGCMRAIPASHRAGQLPHGVANQSGNLLSVNQEISADRIDESTAVELPLRAGQASIHDGLTIHGSCPNHSKNRRRCGLTLRFTTPDVVPAVGDAKMVQWHPILVSGQDIYRHFQLDSAPQFVAGVIR